jgi:glutathione S-transferase
MMKLYDFLPCPFGQKVRIVLAEKSLTYELNEIDLSQGDQRRPEFRRLNPFARVPVLLDEDTAIYDSTIIIEYLEDEYPEPPVLPSIGSSALRARARMFEDFADTLFTPQVGQLMSEMARAENERDQARIQGLQRRIEQALDYVNHELNGQQFLAGDFSIADIAFTPRVLVLSELGIEVGANRSNVEGWMRRLLERPSIQSLQGVTLEPLAGV